MLSDVDFERILICASEANISNIHLQANNCVWWRRYGILSPLREYKIKQEDIYRLYNKMKNQASPLDGNVFMFYMDSWRYKVEYFLDGGNSSLNIKCYPRVTPILEDLGESGAMVINHLRDCKNGLVIIGGSPYSGKTTLASSYIKDIISRRVDIAHLALVSDLNEGFFKTGNSKYILSHPGGISHLSTVERLNPNIVLIDDEFARYDTDTYTIKKIFNIAKSCLVVLVVPHAISDSFCEIFQDEPNLVNAFIVQYLAKSKRGGFIPILEKSVPEFKDDKCRELIKKDIMYFKEKESNKDNE